MNIYAKAIGVRLTRTSALDASARLQETSLRLRRKPCPSLRHMSERAVDAITIISNTEAEA
jgi:hypothetical protein